MDLSKLSNEDLMALKSGDLTKVSNDGLMSLQGNQPVGQKIDVSQPPNWFERQLAKLPNIPFAEKGGPISGFVQGMADPSVGFGQAAANLLPDSSGIPQATNRGIQEQNAGYEQARHEQGRGGFDAMRFAGNVASPVNIIGTKSLPSMTGMSAPALIGTGAAIGAAGGASQPVLRGESPYWAQKAGQTALGAAAGAVVPAIGSALEATRSGAKGLMQSALKPTIEQLRKGKADVAVQTLLDEGINATQGGVDVLRSRIGDLNSQVADKIQNSAASISKQDVMNALQGVENKFANQVNPTSDLTAIQNAGIEFSNHPLIRGEDIPVQLAQQLKQGTYKVLSGKYGETGSAATEAQKALARALKDGISNAVPEVAGLNAQEAKLLTTLGVTERRALMDANKNPLGLASLASNPAGWAAFMADKSALFKSLVARLMNQAPSGQAFLNGSAALAPTTGNVAAQALRSGSVAGQ